MRTEFIVIDTNTLISAFLLEKSVSRSVYEKAKNTFNLAVSRQTFAELQDVLLRSKFDRYLSREIRFEIISEFSNLVTFFEPGIKIELSRDPDDDKFLELALEAKAKYLVTGDNDLLGLNHSFKFSIIKPADFANLANLK
ncbi:putative toxin-antitoxin system toxin component, PIN family [Mariniradius sediminis]|uniref:Toxin-antitoxin system toxin component, PIN family n=1 Tax=Mariniradius sediminis TaxID=2909237 RepID=A0ABS9BNB1_9BACT|nr:putative toxin-antitoxin system toxin component, PIN family [Mariniradius sediminis]MCF1749533.1 putative toxin-antitoxin system toxin component, PIN family [Mariniradius sediminis]